MFEADGLEKVNAAAVLLQFGVVSESVKLPVPLLLPEPGAAFVSQAIGCHVRWMQRQGVTQVGLPLHRGLARHAEDEIERDIVDSAAQKFNSTRHVGRGMVTFENAQQVRIDR